MTVTGLVIVVHTLCNGRLRILNALLFHLLSRGLRYVAGVEAVEALKLEALRVKLKCKFVSATTSMHWHCPSQLNCVLSSKLVPKKTP
jgi:hypothetical protein